MIWILAARRRSGCPALENYVGFIFVARIASFERQGFSDFSGPRRVISAGKDC